MVDIVGQPVHRFSLFLHRDTKPVIGLRSVPVPQLKEIFSERLVAEANLGTTLVEPSAAADDPRDGHDPIVDQPGLDSALDGDERRLDHDRVVPLVEEV